jgi:hypothetical protein
MKKLVMLILLSLGLVACGEKFPYTSQRDKEKMSKELLVAIEKAQKTQDQEDTKVAMEKMGEIIKIITELEKRSSSGDEKAKEELDKWEKILKEIKPQV